VRPPRQPMAGTQPRRGPTDLDAPRISRPWSARVLRPRAHAGRKRPAGHLARPLDDGRLLDATRNFSLSHRTHQARLPERRPEAGPWQERRGGCGKSSEHDHYFPSRADRFTRVVSGIENVISSLRRGLKSCCFLAIGCRKLGIAFTFACAARVCRRRKLPDEELRPSG
jgi:hypothetical protein